jgi:hypothetical protein
MYGRTYKIEETTRVAAHQPRVLPVRAAGGPRQGRARAAQRAVVPEPATILQAGLRGLLVAGRQHLRRGRRRGRLQRLQPGRGLAVPRHRLPRMSSDRGAHTPAAPPGGRVAARTARSRMQATAQTEVQAMPRRGRNHTRGSDAGSGRGPRQPGRRVPVRKVRRRAALSTPAPLPRRASRQRGRRLAIRGACPVRQGCRRIRWFSEVTA